MPTMLLSKSRFFHIPKCGGNWVSAALREAGVPAEEVLGGHGHAGYWDAPGSDRDSFACVREPTDWYRSYWAYKQNLGWDLDANENDRRYCANRFSRFLELVLQDGNPIYTETLQQYQGPGVRLFPMENLRGGLLQTLRDLGEPIPRPQAIFQVPAQNRSPSVYRRQAVYSGKLLLRLRQLEYRAVDLHRQLLTDVSWREQSIARGEVAGFSAPGVELYLPHADLH